jgi:hypothetical protein
LVDALSTRLGKHKLCKKHVGYTSWADGTAWRYHIAWPFSSGKLYRAQQEKDATVRVSRNEHMKG